MREGRDRRRRRAGPKPAPATAAEVVIARVGHRGDGIADTPGGAVYVPFSLPGERLAIRRRGERGETVAILAASPERVDPICRHFGVCGGCRLQHWARAPYLAWKRDQVVCALAARGLDVPVAPVVEGGAHARRRAVLSARVGRNDVALGYHGPASRDIVAVAECPALAPALEGALRPLADLLAAAGPARGELRVTMCDSPAGLDVAVEGADAPTDAATRQRIADLARSATFARLSWDGDLLFQGAPPAQDFGGIAMVPPPAAFLQATRPAEEVLAGLVLAGVGAAARVADLFAGCGTFALRLARHARVTAVEADAAALAALEKAARAPGLKPVSCLRRDLFRDPLAADELATFDAVVLDPPFAGAPAQAAALAASAVPRIVMVSCNPATFARDARRLVDGGYRLACVRPVDQFLFSPHIELVGTFTRDVGTGS